MSGDIAKLGITLRSRVLHPGRLRRLLEEEGDLETSEGDAEQGLLPLCCVATVAGRAVLEKVPSARGSRGWV